MPVEKRAGSYPRRRLKRHERREALLDLAAEIIATDGADKLTLLTLADAGGVTKPVTYSQFGNRQGLFEAIFERYDRRFFDDLEAGLKVSNGDLENLASAFADSYLTCISEHGQVYEAAIAALRCYPDHCNVGARIRLAFQKSFCGIIDRLKLPIEVPSNARVFALYGAIEELGRAFVSGQISRDDVYSELKWVFSALLRKTCNC